MQPFCLLLAGLSLVQNLPPVSSATDYARLHEGVNPPRLIHSADPAYTREALAAGIEGAVAVQAVVDTHGDVTYASVLSPLPDGLDQEALTVLKRWKYAPAVMDNELIPVLITIDVSFKLPYRPHDDDAVGKKRRVDDILQLCSKDRHCPGPGELKQVSDLAQAETMAAIGLLGQWKLNGTGMAQDVPGGLADVRRAAEGDDPASLEWLAKAEIAGEFVRKNEVDGRKRMERAAYLGNSEAQRLMGEKHEQNGKLDEAKGYFRLCAATGHSYCEYRLGRLLVQGPGVNPNDFTQGVTWLELAKDRGSQEARTLWETTAAELSSVQLDWLRQLKPQLELKHYKGF